MPAVAKYAINNRAGFLEQTLHVGMARDSLGVCVGAKGAEPLGECLLVFERDVLVAKVDHLVAMERGLHLFELLIGNRSQVDALDFGTHGARQRNRLDHSVTVGFVVEIGGRIELHAVTPVVFVIAES